MDNEFEIRQPEEQAAPQQQPQQEPAASQPVSQPAPQPQANRPVNPYYQRPAQPGYPNQQP